MIGIKKNIIAISVGLGQFVMINPVILKKSKPYDTEESCLSLLGGPRKCKRYEEIEVLNYEYRYPVGQYLLSPIAGLIDPKDKNHHDQ